MTGVPAKSGGLWESTEISTRPVCEVLRTLAHGDPSVALVSSMHPSVMAAAGWLLIDESAPPTQNEWAEQREWAFGTAKDGHFWGTIVSEPGSGGDSSKSSSVARKGTDGNYLLTGTKHFGSGTGMTSFMITTAMPEGEDEVAGFHMDLRDVPLDGSRGVELAAPWDGHGMTATQSHALTFKDFSVVQRAWTGPNDLVMQTSAPPVHCMFSAVIVGVVETAIGHARSQLARKKDSMGPYEQIEWANIEVDGWMVQQAYQGMLRSMEDPSTRLQQSRLGKLGIAQLAESLLTRISRVVGGSSFSRHMPYGFWAQDVRALGFLRPPWGLAYSQVIAGSWDETGEG